MKPIAMLCIVAGVFCLPANSQQSSSVSIIQLIASPTAFDGKPIVVEGFLRTEFENTELYMHREDSEHALYGNGIWVDIPSSFSKRRTALEKRYVRVEGDFDARSHGHMGVTSGTLKNVRSIDLIARSSQKRE